MLSAVRSAGRCSFILAIESMLCGAWRAGQVGIRTSHSSTESHCRAHPPPYDLHPLTQGSFAHSPTVFEPRSAARQKSTGS